MRIFSIHPDGAFSEFTQEPFQVKHEEKNLEQDRAQSGWGP